MEALICDITIGDLTFDFVHQVTIESHWEELTQTAVIMLPSSLKVDKNKLKNAIPKGSAVTIKLGYESTGLTEIFNGFVSRVLPNVPLEIHCEDLMWKLKQHKVTENAKNETFQSYLSKVLPYPVDCFEIKLPKFVVVNMTGAKLLNQLKEDYGFPIFVRNGKIVVGKQYDPSNKVKHIFVIDNSDKSNIKSQKLEYKDENDVVLKVTAISNLSNGKKIEVEIGEDGGDSKTMNFFDLQKDELTKIATEYLKKLMYKGFRGQITVFGHPIVKHGDVVELRNDQESDKTGVYWVDGVTTEFGVNGFQQTIKIGSIT